MKKKIVNNFEKYKHALRCVGRVILRLFFWGPLSNNSCTFELLSNKIGHKGLFSNLL